MIGPLAHSTFDLLELLALHPFGMTSAGIAMRFGTKLESADRRIARARDHGYVTTTKADHYTPQSACLTSLGRLRLAQAFAYLDQRTAA